jgi:hypothetical protein
MREMTACLLALCTAVSAFGQDAQWRYRRLLKGAEVHLVLRSGGECDGKVVERREPLVTIRVTRDRQACGGKETLTLDTQKISAADPESVDPSLKREVGAAAATAAGTGVAAAGTYAAASALGRSGHPAIAAGFGLAGLVAIPMAAHAAARRSQNARQRFVLYVDEVASEEKAPR